MNTNNTPLTQKGLKDFITSQEVTIIYGKELILDLHECGVREDLQDFCEELCDLIDMRIEDFHWWKSSEEDERNPKTYGVSCIQFILTSNITVHTLPLMNAVYINLFSCKEFDDHEATKFCVAWFDAKKYHKEVVIRH